jgi:glycosyltransferase involved in cell wall biosynthesis
MTENTRSSTLCRHSIIIPAYNEEAALSGFLAALCAEQKLKETEIIVVDDGSTDRTAIIVEQFAGEGRIRLVRHGHNKGYGSALVTGMRIAEREFVTWVDSDGQHRIEDLVCVMERLDAGDVDFCIGIRDAQSHQEKSRVLGKWILRHAVNFAARQSVPDFNSGLRGFRRSVILHYLHLLPERFGASTTTSLLMLERGYRGVNIPITVLQRQGVSSVKIVRDGLRTLMLVFRIFLLFRPLHFFGIAGLAATALGCVYGFWIVFMEKLGFPVFGLVVIAFGIQTILLGLIMDAISSLRRDRFTIRD